MGLGKQSITHTTTATTQNQIESGQSQVYDQGFSPIQIQRIAANLDKYLNKYKKPDARANVSVTVDKVKTNETQQAALCLCILSNTLTPSKSKRYNEFSQQSKHLVNVLNPVIYDATGIEFHAHKQIRTENDERFVASEQVLRHFSALVSYEYSALRAEQVNLNKQLSDLQYYADYLAHKELKTNKQGKGSPLKFLVEDLQLLTDKFFIEFTSNTRLNRVDLNEANYKAYKTAIDAKITSSPFLKYHRGWQRALMYLSLSIFAIGPILAVIDYSSKYIFRNKYVFYNETYSARMINKFQTQAQTLNITACTPRIA